MVSSVTYSPWMSRSFCSKSERSNSTCSMKLSWQERKEQQKSHIFTYMFSTSLNVLCRAALSSFKRQQTMKKVSLKQDSLSCWNRMFPRRVTGNALHSHNWPYKWAYHMLSFHKWGYHPMNGVITNLYLVKGYSYNQMQKAAPSFDARFDAGT